MKKSKPLNWDKEHRKKGYDVCKCGAVNKYCQCEEKIKRMAKND